MKHFVRTCPHCRRVKQIDKWVPIDKKLDAVLANGEMDENTDMLCPDCTEKAGVTNRLLPVVDKNERQLLAT